MIGEAAKKKKSFLRGPATKKRTFFSTSHINPNLARGGAERPNLYFCLNITSLCGVFHSK